MWLEYIDCVKINKYSTNEGFQYVLQFIYIHQSVNIYAQYFMYKTDKSLFVGTCTLDMYNMLYLNKSECNTSILLIISITINHNIF